MIDLVPEKLVAQQLISTYHTSRPSDPVDFENFTGDGFQNPLTGLSNFSPGSNIKTIMADVKNRPGMDKVAGDFPAGIFSHRGFPRWVLFLPGWEPAGHFSRDVWSLHFPL